MGQYRILHSIITLSKNIMVSQQLHSNMCVFLNVEGKTNSSPPPFKTFFYFICKQNIEYVEHLLNLYMKR